MVVEDWSGVGGSKKVDSPFEFCLIDTRQADIQAEATNEMSIFEYKIENSNKYATNNDNVRILLWATGNLKRNSIINSNLAAAVGVWAFNEVRQQCNIYLLSSRYNLR